MAEEGGLRPDAQEILKRAHKIVESLRRGEGSTPGPRAELDALLGELVASELYRATHSITVNLIELGEKVGLLGKIIEKASVGASEQISGLTAAITSGATALNTTAEAGNKLNWRIGWLTVVTVALTVVQIFIAARGH